MSSFTQGSASAAGSAGAGRPRLALVAGGIVFALALAVVLLRFQRLHELPPGLAADQGVDGVLALQVLQGEHAVFFPVELGREASAIYAIALTTSFLGRTLLAMQLPTALGSAGLVFVVFWLGRLLFGRDESGRATPWRGLLVGGVGAGLLAVSLSQTVIGRSAYNKVTHLPLLLSLCLALLWWGWMERVRHGRPWWRFALAGVCAGLLPYTYSPARFTPFLFLFFGLSFLLPFRSDTWEPGQVARHCWARLRAVLPWAGVFVGVAGLVAAPLLVHFALHPEHFFMRSSHLWVFDPARSQGDPLGSLLRNVWGHLLAFGFRGDPEWTRNFDNQPMMNLWVALLFWLGVGMAVWRWQRPAYRLLLLWLGVMLVPAMLAKGFRVPDTLRMVGAVPAIYLLAAVGAWEVFRFLQKQFFQKDATKAAIAMGAAISGLILAQGVNTYHTYYHKWANAPEVYEAHEVWWTDLARALNSQLSAADMVYLIPTFHRHYNFEYLYQGSAPAYMVSMAAPNLAQRIQSTLTAVEHVSLVKVMEWNTTKHWIEDDTEPFAFLLGKYGRYLGSDEFAEYTIHNYVEISLARPWTFYEKLEPLPVNYDGGISLYGLALGQGEEQLSTQQLVNLGLDRSLWGALQWQTSPGLDVDYAISLRLYNAEGESAYQADDVIWKPTNHTPTSQWSADEMVDSLFWVEFPADLPPGDYELRMVVYNFETLAPIVEVGVWEPETLLARLRLAEVR